MFVGAPFKIQLLLCLQARLAEAAENTFLPGNLTGWFHQSSVISGDWLFVDGGEVMTLGNGPVWNQQTIAFDLSTSWSTKSVSPVVSNKTDPNPLARRPDIWYDPLAEMVYSMGGWGYEFAGDWYRNSTPVSLWGFKPQKSGVVEWREQPWSPKQNAANLSSNVVWGLTATSPKAHYSLGGGILIDPEHGSDNAQSLQEIVSYSFSEQTWTNQSIPNKYYLFGEGQFIEHYGSEGVILFFGGQWAASTSEKKSSLQSLDTILIYDIQSKKFYEQEASNPPATRAQFCSVGAGTADNSSYEIFIYGGQFGGGGDIPQFNEKEDLKSVYILTIPAFTWIKANTEAVSRAFHTCKKAGKRQMISIGGRRLENGDKSPEPWSNGLGIFDMTTLKWSENYDSKAQDYTPHSMVTTVYSDASIHPTNWSNPALLDIFKVRLLNDSSMNNSSDTATTTSTPNNTPPTAAPDKGPSNNNSIKIIVPSIIAGIAILAILISLFFYLRKRTRQPSQEDYTTAKTSELKGETWKRQEVHGNSSPAEMDAYGQYHHYHEMDSVQALRPSELPGSADSRTGLRPNT
ncbi:hypothetical protein HYFRA_00003318 [Hymenoscyphus fraxineus]|uniref:Kelch repeat protein n=1 Tax=Hymenoscyphus fraxineus TaxID=746836 RepID=A0A9N9PRI2_9HELO|nr:hypothetical protein HYFRA_00003318 [Hymenoscyphus fraxineus]